MSEPDEIVIGLFENVERVVGQMTAEMPGEDERRRRLMARRRLFTSRLYRAARLSNIAVGRLLRRGVRAAEVAEMSDAPEIFEIDTELTRDAIYAGIWTRLCVEMRSPPEGNRLEHYINRLSEGRGDPTELLGYLDTDVGWLTDARRRLRAVEGTPLGSKVELDDVHRFMPKAWHEEPGRWIYTDTELGEIEEHGGHVVRVRAFGSDEQWRGQ